MFITTRLKGVKKGTLRVSRKLTRYICIWTAHIRPLILHHPPASKTHIHAKISRFRPAKAPVSPPRMAQGWFAYHTKACPAGYVA